MIHDRKGKMCSGYAVRARYTGTHSAELCSVPATGKKISFEALEIFRMENSKIVESWGYWPDMQILEQLTKPW